MSEHLTLVNKLKQRAKEHGDSPAFIFRSPNHGRYVLSWAQLHRLAGCFAADLNSNGLRRGELVVNTLLNSPERVVCEAGIWMSGAASVNGHCQMADGSDLMHTIRISRASALLVDPDVHNSPWKVLKGHISLGEGKDVTSSALPDLKKLFFIRRVEGGDEEDFITRLEQNVNEWFEADDVTPEDILTVFTTSGTTGFSKLVVYTNSDYALPLEGQLAVEEYSKTFSDVSMFKTAPLGWLGGYAGFGVVCFHVSVMCDARAGEIEDLPALMSEAVEEEGCVSAFIAPMYLPPLARLVQNRHKNSDVMTDVKVKKLENIFLGGLPVTRQMVECALLLANSVLSGYGATDFSFVSAMIVKDSDTFVEHDTGIPIKGVSVKIVSQDDEDTVLPANQVGNILIKGPTRNQGYLNDPNLRTEDCITKDGYFRTQDLGYVDERGHLIVHGRGCDAIMRGPYIFYPSWIEARIRACPGVCDVIVTGIPDPFLNEELCACVILDSNSVTLDQVRQFVEKDMVTSDSDPLSPRPRYYLEFESFPVTDTGKPKRRLVKAQAAEKVNDNVVCDTVPSK